MQSQWVGVCVGVGVGVSWCVGVCLGVCVGVSLGVWVCVWVGGEVERERERGFTEIGSAGGWQVRNLQGGPAGWRSRQASTAVQIQRLIASRVPDRSLLWVLAGGLCLC